MTVVTQARRNSVREFAGFNQASTGEVLLGDSNID